MRQFCHVSDDGKSMNYLIDTGELTEDYMDHLRIELILPLSGATVPVSTAHTFETATQYICATFVQRRLCRGSALCGDLRLSTEDMDCRKHSLFVGCWN